MVEGFSIRRLAPLPTVTLPVTFTPSSSEHAAPFGTLRLPLTIAGLPGRVPVQSTFWARAPAAVVRYAPSAATVIMTKRFIFISSSPGATLPNQRLHHLPGRWKGGLSGRGVAPRFA